MNLEAARRQMIDQQVRAWEVLDDAVLDVLRAVPRERFVPEAYREIAFADMEIPLGPWPAHAAAQGGRPPPAGAARPVDPAAPDRHLSGVPPEREVVVYCS